MSETLNINIQSIFENGNALSNCSCTLILGSKLVNSNIPTQTDIQIPTTKIRDSENLTLLIKEQNEVIAKALIPLSTLRHNTNEHFSLVPLGNKAEIGSNLTWEISLEIDREIIPENQTLKVDNPFDNILLKSGGEFTSEMFASQSLTDKRIYESQTEREKAHNEALKNPHTFADLPGGSHQSLTMEGSGHFHHSPVKVKLDNLLNVLDEKLKDEAAQGLPNLSEVNNLFQSLKVSIDELQKEVTYGNSPKAQFGDISENRSNVQMDRFGQSAPVYSTKDFIHTDDNTSPQFSGDIHKPSNERFYSTEGLHNVHLRVPGGKERKYSDDSGRGIDFEKLNASERNSRRTSKIYNETGRSHLDDVKIEKNEDYLLTMKNQLTSKNLTFINDQMTRDIILYMAQNKKKISAIRLRRSITIGDKEDVDIDKKEYFNTNCNAKFLHFFQASSKILYLFNLVQPFELIEEKARKIKMDIDYDISIHHKSVITPAGMIFIAGAKPNFNASNVDIGSNSLHLYNYKTQSLIDKAPMNCKTRSEFGLCYMSKNLFAIGGIVNGQISANCERYDIRSNKWIKIAPMSRPLREASVCSFNNRYIYRIFGIDSGNNIDHSIERYDAVRDSWTVMNTTVSPTLKEIYRPFCTQISPDCIFMFGGKNVYGFSPKSCKGWVLKVEEKRGSNNADLVESRNFIPGLAGNFNQNSILTHAGDILFLRESY